jgi:hypothetical protein
MSEKNAPVSQTLVKAVKASQTWSNHFPLQNWLKFIVPSGAVLGNYHPNKTLIL